MGMATKCLLPELAGGAADLVLTSHPYWGRCDDYGGSHGLSTLSRWRAACTGALKPGGVLVWVVR